MTEDHRSELDNARRTIDKAQEALEACENYFTHQAEMNAQAHMGRVLYPPIHAAITSVLQSITMFNETYPRDGAGHEPVQLSPADRSFDERGMSL